MEIFEYIIGLGAAVMMPIIFTILGVCLGIKPSKALLSGLYVGVGFVGLGIVTSLLTTTLGPILGAIVENYGLKLAIFDMGWPAAAAVAYNAPVVGALIIPVCLAVNLLMIVTKTTRTVNIDLWNYWHFAFIGAVVYFATYNNLVADVNAANYATTEAMDSALRSVSITSICWGMFAAIVCYIITMVLADMTAKQFQGFYKGFQDRNFDGISVPQPFCQGFVPFAVLINKALDLIPGFDKLYIDAEGMKKKLGILGEPLILGVIVGGVIAAVAQFGATKEVVEVVAATGGEASNLLAAAADSLAAAGSLAADSLAAAGSVATDSLAAAGTIATDAATLTPAVEVVEAVEAVAEATPSVADKIKEILVAGVKMGAVMALIPRITGFFIEGLEPISSATKDIIAKKFKNSAGLNIGMTPALVIGHPTTLVSSLILIPIILFISVVLPGNQFLPLASLAGMFYVFPMILPITKGNVVKSVIIGLVALVVGLYFVTDLAPSFSLAARDVYAATGDAAVHIPDGFTEGAALDFASGLFTWVIYHLIHSIKVIGPVVLGLFTLGMMFINRKQIVKSEKETK